MYNYTYYDYGYDYGSNLSGILGGLLIFLIIVLIISLAVGIVTLIAQWKLYKKAGKGGWEAIVPFYTNWVLVEIAGLKWYWFLFFFAPFVFELIGIDFIGWLAYLFAMFNIFYNISKRFNKGIGFAICATLFTPICIAILGFSSKEKYDGNVAVSEHGVFGGSGNSTQQNVQPQPTVEPTQTNETVQPESNVNQQTAPAFCTNCGNALMPNAKFCTNCGKQI